MKVLLAVAVIVLTHSIDASLIIKGPTGPVLEGDRATLECRYTDSEQNISQVHFEVFHKSSGTWRPIPYWGGYFGSYCALPSRYMQEVEDTGDSRVLTIAYSGRYLDGLYRCVSDAENVTAPDNSSQALAFKVHYMGQLIMTREGYTRFLGVPTDLKVRQKDEVVLKCSASASEELSYSWSKKGSDWILPSSTLTLKKMTAMDEGDYTCMAKHESVESLSQKRTVRITVLPEDAPWYDSSNGRVVLMTSAAAVSLLVFIVSVSVFLCRRAKQQAASTKGPIDDHSQKKPIYRGSADSLPSACGDKQPLV